MIKDTKYIIKRILIGVGIILVLGFIRSNKAHALENVDIPWSSTSNNAIISDSSYQLLGQSGTQRIYRNRDSGDFAFCWTSGGSCDVMNPGQNFEYTNVGLMIKNTADTYQNIAFFTNNTTLPSIGYASYAPVNLTSHTLSIYLYKIGNINNPAYITTNIGDSGEKAFTVYGYGTYFDYFSNTSWRTDYGKTPNRFEILPPTASTIESLQPSKITNNNVITGYIFRPKFTNFNTDNFVYQYKVGKDSSRWLSLTENEQQIKINNNTILYVRIKDKNSNEVVDSQTFTITNISKFDTKQDYNITFSGEYRTENYLNNNISSKSQSLIKEYQIYVDYTPKTSTLKYQYQYVKDGDTLDNNNWQNVSSFDNGSFTYVASENGTLYARILDSSDNNLYSATFTVNSIGLLAFDNNEKGIDNFFTKISNKINYGGPITILFKIPVDFFSTLYNTASNSNSCVPYKISNLMGTDITLPCINFRDKFGSTIYNEIDAIFTFIFAIGFFKFIYKKYDQFVSLENPDKGGDK